jgi:puromycin-sensitive aminopeptidase
VTDPNHARRDSASEEESSYRLPRDVAPCRYELVIIPDLDTATFTGEERIEVEVRQPVGSIVLNAASLEVGGARLVPVGDGGDHLEGEVVLDHDAERLTVRLAREAQPGRWYLHLAFAGHINDKLAGFYRSTFTNASGSTSTLGVTDFEPTDARRAFPCWDEPDRKAVFSLTLLVPEGLEAFSNTAVAEEQAIDGGRRRVRFADTMPMSTYLVAWAIGPLEATQPVDVDGTPLRVVHVPGKSHLTSYALEVGAHALRFFTEWFGLAYPGDKLDLLAIPDFAFGAMENLGAVAFRESLLLVDPTSASQLELQRIADVICHEIAHMWFGDLVTMRWWNGLWLNEAFATFMEVLAVDDFRPEWQRWVSFARSRSAALVTDGLSTTRPIEYEVRQPKDAQGMFDVLTYEKGAGVLRMLERYLGAKDFQEGIRRYLAAHRYANAETTDLWDAIEEASGEPARATMDSWIFQGGYPLVSVAEDGDGLRLDQRLFRYLGSSGTRTSWRVPLLARGSAGGQAFERRLLLDRDGARLDLPAPPDWVVVNAGGHGFFRVAYSPRLLAGLTADLSRLGSLERFNLVSDTLAATLADLAPASALISLLGLLAPSEDDPDVWSVAASALSLLERVAPPGDRPAIQGFARSLLRPAFDRLGWEPNPGEDQRRGTLRATLLAALGTWAADLEIRRQAITLHGESLAGRATIPPDLADAVVGAVAAGGGQAAYDTCYQTYCHPATPQEEERYLYSLAGFEEPELVARTLELSITKVRTQNAPFLIAHLLANRAGGPAAWHFVAKHWDRLLSRFPDSSIPHMLETIPFLLQPGVSAEVHEFFSTHSLRSGQRTLEQTLERLDINVAFRDREGANLAPFLAK